MDWWFESDVKKSSDDWSDKTTVGEQSLVMTSVRRRVG